MSYFLSLLNHAAVFGAIAAVQALLLNRLGLAFAALPAFVGLAAYAVATSETNTAASFLLWGLLCGVAVVAAWLANRLRRDYFLLASLALLECLAAFTGMSESLGGREGLASPAALGGVGGPGFEQRMAGWTIGGLVVVLVVCRYLLATREGVVIDRVREHPGQVSRWLRADAHRKFLVLLAAGLAAGLGVLYLRYEGRVTPAIFSLDFALMALAFTIMSMRAPELGALAALLYWSLPYFMSKGLPLSMNDVAELVRIVWGLLLLASVLVPFLLEQRRRRGHGA